MSLSPSEHAERLRDIEALANSLRVGWNESLPRDVITGLRRIEELANLNETPFGYPRSSNEEDRG